MIYLVRHGEAAAKWGSHPDPGLSEQGREQALRTAQTLAPIGIERAFSSPMARCRETGAAFEDLTRVTIAVEPRVTEIPTPPETPDRVAWLRALMSGSWPQAPDIVQSWREDLVQTIEAIEQPTVVFTHFVAINALVAAIENISDVTVFRPNYCSVTTLERHGDSLRVLKRGNSLETKVL